MTSIFKVALIGFGKIAQSYSSDAKMAAHLKYVTHLQVLRDHPKLELLSIVDTDPQTRARANELCPEVEDIAENAHDLQNREQIDLVVLACPPESHLETISAFPQAKALMVEKPLGASLADALAFWKECIRRRLLTQVNITRRADDQTRRLAAGALSEMIGEIQAISGIYGNGINNNATHIVDLIRMLAGEVVSVQSFPDNEFIEGPLKGDANFPFALNLKSKVTAFLSPVRYNHYREFGIQIWGTKARFDYWHSGLTMSTSSVGQNRYLENSKEIISDNPTYLTHTLGTALYKMYENLIDSCSGAELLSSIESAIVTTSVIDAIFRSKQSKRLCSPIAVECSSR